MNRVYLIGRAVRDLVLQHFGEDNKSYVNFTLAVDEYNSKTKESTANFINIVAFDKKAELLAKYIAKGNQLSVEGKLRTSAYTDQNNKKKYSTAVILENFKFLEKKSDAI